MNLRTLVPPRGALDESKSQFDVQPLDPPRASASGPAPYRVLAIGGLPLAGKGVLTHELAVTGALARALAKRLGHGFDVESIIATSMDVDAAEFALASIDLRRFDVLLLAIEPDRSARRDHDEQQRRLQSLLIDAALRMPEGSVITVATAPSLRPRGMSPDAEHAFSRMAQRAVRSLARFVELENAPEKPAVELYAGWAEQLADATTPGLREPQLWRNPEDAGDDAARGVAVESLGDFDDEWTAVFRRIVSFARTAYGTTCAALSVVDEAQTHYTACVGREATSDPRDQSICDLVVRTYGGVIVGDATADERFRDMEGVRAGRVGFYAGYRVNDPDGVPVAALCVYDPQSRVVMEQDLALLRDFAVAAERRLWELSRTRSLRSSME